MWKKCAETVAIWLNIALQEMTLLVRDTLELPLVLLEWLMTYLGRLCNLPVVLLYEIRNAAIIARDRANDRLFEHCARRTTMRSLMSTDAELLLVQQQFEQILTTIDRVDRRHAHHSPHFRESLETAMAAFNETMAVLRQRAGGEGRDGSPSAVVSVPWGAHDEIAS